MNLHNSYNACMARDFEGFFPSGKKFSASLMVHNMFLFSVDQIRPKIFGNCQEKRNLINNNNLIACSDCKACN